MGRKISLQLIQMLFQSLRRGKINDQFPITQSRFGHRTHQIITRRGSSQTGRHRRDFRPTHQVSLHRSQIPFHGFRIRSERHFILNIQLIIAQIREKTLLDKTVTIHTENQQNNRRQNPSPTIMDGKTEQLLILTINSPVKRILRFAGPHCLNLKSPIRLNRNIRQCQYPTQPQRNRQDDKKIPDIFSGRIGRQINGQESQYTDGCCPQ